MKQGLKMGGVFEVECIAPDGKLKWREKFDNLVTDEGVAHILNTVLHGGTQYTTWYVGLIDASPTLAAGDDAQGLHLDALDWSEFTSYSASTRPAYNEAAASGGSITNSANKASFSINANGSSIGGAFLIDGNDDSVADNVLLSEAAFSGGNKSADSGDTLNVTYTFSAADDGA